MENLYLYAALVVSVYFIIFFIIGQILRDNSIVDIGWGLGFAVLAAALAIRDEFQNTKGIIVLVLVALWGLRLTIYLFNRNKGKPEDFRYVNLRKRWGTKWALLKAFLNVYALQGVVLYIVSISFMYIFNSETSELIWLDYVAIGIWLIGFLFESIGDYQLKMFKAKPENKGRIIQSGLWKYTRHPNYFGNATMWWGIYLLALTSGGWLTFFSPLIMTLFLLFVSGVPLLEKKKANHPEYQQYKQVTPKFFPWFPKSRETDV